MAKNTFKERMVSYVEELVNPMSYYEWIHKNTTIQGLPFTCDKYPFQKAILDDVSRELHCIKPSQIGLALDVETPILTSQGWSTMGKVQVGDEIYAPDGTLTKVTFKSEVYTNHKCYELTFSDGTKIIADENHRWKVSSISAFNTEGFYTKSGRIPIGSSYATTNVVNSHFLFLNHKLKKDSFYIPTTEPLVGMDVDIDIDPYLLGLWLGDGSSASGHITSQNSDLVQLESLLLDRNITCEIFPQKDNISTVKIQAFKGAKFFTWLNKNKLINNKHIPKKYLFASKETRLELLRGLIDTDGCISKLGRITFTNCSKQLISDVQDLIHSLGFKSGIRWREPKKNILKNGQVISAKQQLAEIDFMVYSEVRVANYERKFLNQKTSGRISETKRRFLIKVVEVPSTPVQCLTVDHPEHLFLCSKALIATHNTELQLRKALAFVARNPHRNLIYTMPDENMRKRVFQNRVQPILTQDKVFQEPNAMGQKPIRSIEMTEINSSFMLMFPANEKSATSQPADAVFNDEIDLSDPQIIALFNSRLQGSDIKMNHNFSTPTYQGIGIDALYETSDQHEYLFKCPHCGFYQIPTFNSKFIRIPGLPAEASDDLSKFELTWLTRYNINPLDAYSVCSKCDKRVTYGDDENHAWVAKHPHRTNSRGYKISPFSTRNLDAPYVLDTLIKYIRGDNLKGFKNTVLGETHENSDERLPETLLRALFTAHFDPIYEMYNHIPHFIGIDMGKICHITIAAAEGVNNVKTVLFETVKAEQLLDRIDSYMKAFPIKLGFIDRLPLITESDRVRDRTNKMIMPMQYDIVSGGSILIPKNDEYGNLSYVAAHRTMHLDLLANALKNGWFTFSGYGSQKETIINHLRAMVRMVVEGKDGSEKVPTWIKKDKNDHYFHSTAYMYQAVNQYYNGYSFLPQESYNSTIFLGGIDDFILPTHSLFGRN